MSLTQTLSTRSRLHHHQFAPVINLQHDINHVLNCFNELDRKNIGYITKQSVRVLFRSIQSINYEQQLSMYQSDEKFEFDHVLSILGKVQHPQQPSIYVVSFVKILAQFRNTCLSSDNNEQQKLVQAQQIEQKIKNVINAQIKRQTQRLSLQHNLAYSQMQQSQNQQLQAFQQQWSTYISQFQTQNTSRLNNTIQTKNKSLQHQQSRFNQTSRRYSIITSTKLTQLQQRKQRFIKQGKYNQALGLKQKITKEKTRLTQQKQTQTSFAVTRRFQSLKKKNQNILQTTIMIADNDVKKLIKKKYQGQHLLKIRMKTIRQQTTKKLAQNLKKQINRLKSMFYQASRK